MKKILLIEDEKDTIKTLSTALKLEEEEYEISSAEDGRSGLELARKNKPDIILLDILLPNLSGIEVCRSLKSDEEYKSIPIIMLTALDQTENIVEGFSAGANDYVTKPFNFPELLARIKTSLRMKELYDAAKIAERNKADLLDASEQEIKSIAKFPSEDPNPVIRVSKDGIILYANKACFPLFEMWGCKTGQRLPEHLNRFLYDVFASTKNNSIDIECGDRIFSFQFAIVPNAGYVNIYGMDITTRKRAEKERESLITDLNQANEELKDFAYIVSHDLKAPLRAIHNYTDFLQEDLKGRLEEEEQINLDGLALAVRQSEEFINDLLELSRLSRYETTIENINVGNFIKTLIASLGIPSDVEIVMVDDWPTVNSEPVLLRQIFMNLINNAVKFNRSSHKLIELNWHQTNNQHYELFVRDNGIGIEHRFFEQVFRPFQRLHTSKEFEGTGIGLAIVNKAANRLKGSVRVESNPGKGSTFFVTIPKDLTY